MNPENLIGQASGLVHSYLIPFGWKILGAIAVWIAGSWLVRLIVAALGRTLAVQKVDPTLGRYIEASATVLMKILVLIAVFSVLGIETTSFAALIAALGIAIGAAWAGLLSNFAAGIFLMTLRPFKVGDMISVAGVTGDVRDAGQHRERAHLYRQRENILRYHPQLHHQPAPARGPDRPDRPQRASAGCDQPLGRARGENPQRAGDAGAVSGDPHF